MLLAAAGDREATGTLFERHHARFYRYFFASTQNQADSMDAVQDVFDRIIRYGHSFRGGAFLPWAFRIARNVSLDRLRHTGSTIADLSDVDPIDSGLLPDGSMEADEQHEELRQALDRLLPQYREVLLLSRYADLSYAEIAAALDCSVGAVKVRVHRALNSLRASYLDVK